MIEYIKGDALETDAKFIAHGCNTKGAMGSGIAYAIRHKYPEVYKGYVKYWQEHGLSLGQVLPIASGDKVILNCMTQATTGLEGKHVSYDAIDMCMEKINTLMSNISNKGHIIAMPMIGAGLGGGSWPVIEAIINHRLANQLVRVYQLEDHK